MVSEVRIGKAMIVYYFLKMGFYCSTSVIILAGINTVKSAVLSAQYEEVRV